MEDGIEIEMETPSQGLVETIAPPPGDGDPVINLFVPSAERRSLSYAGRSRAGSGLRRSLSSALHCMPGCGLARILSSNWCHRPGLGESLSSSLPLVPGPPAPTWKVPSSPTDAMRGRGWMLLDPFVHLSRRQRGVFDGDITTSEVSHDCIGRPITVSLRLADPPAVSRLYLHWTLPQGPGTSNMPDPTIIAADRNAVLFRVSVPFKEPMWQREYMSCLFPLDYFVYSVNTSSPPSLTRLPPCLDGVDENEEDYKMYQPYRRQQQRYMYEPEMGLLCHGDEGEFTVAHLVCLSPCEFELCILHHHPPHASSIPMQWRVYKLPAPTDMKLSGSLWTTDTVFRIDGCLCWVDYYQGMMLVDVFQTNKASDSDSGPDMQPRYIPLPTQALKCSRPYMDAFTPDPFRHVCITDHGLVKLVCIFNEGDSPSTFTIVTWSIDINKGIWIKDRGTSIEAAEFFGMFDAIQCSLPKLTPSFPVVSLADPDIICFRLEEVEEKERKVEQVVYWIIEVNIRNKVLLSTALYIDEEEEEQEEYSTEKPCRTFYSHNFIPSKFSYLNQDGFTRTSRQLSALMEEKAIQRLVRQKEAIKAVQRQVKQNGKAIQRQVKQNGKAIQRQVRQNGKAIQLLMKQKGKAIKQQVKQKGKAMQRQVTQKGKAMERQVKRKGKAMLMLVQVGKQMEACSTSEFRWGSGFLI